MGLSLELSGPCRQLFVVGLVRDSRLCGGGADPHYVAARRTIVDKPELLSTPGSVDQFGGVDRCCPLLLTLLGPRRDERQRAWRWQGPQPHSHAPLLTPATSAD